MAKFRKKPVVIEAVQLDMLDTAKTRALLEAMGATAGQFDMPPAPGGCCWWRQNPDGLPSLIIPTLEGEMEARDGDWIIKGVQGEFYPCKPTIFAATYEVAE